MVEHHVDIDPCDLLVTPNGLLHLPSLATDQVQFFPATPALWTTTYTPIPFKLDAPPPNRFLEFLEELWGDDEESIALLQEWCGYCQTRDTSQQGILFAIGPPRSGKGTIMHLLRRLVGEPNVVHPTLASLSGTFGFQPFLNKSLAVISDARLGSRADANVIVERLLSISGEDPFTVDRKHMSQMTVPLKARVMILTNELPRLRDESGALASRFRILRMTRSFVGSEDPKLRSKLEAELPGILHWALMGLVRLRERGRFIEPASSAVVHDELRDLTSPTRKFVRERCLVSSSAFVPTETLYEAYKHWCRSRGQGQIEQDSTLGRNLRAVVPHILRRQRRIGGKQTWCYLGIGLRS